MHTAFMRTVLGRCSAGLPVQHEIAITADGSAPADDARLWVVESWDTSTIPPDAWGAVGTVIVSNGSTWGGQWPRPMADLLEALATAELDGTRTGAYSAVDDGAGSHLPGGPRGWTRYHGNFVDLSHAFTIDTRDPNVVYAIRAAMRGRAKAGAEAALAAAWASPSALEPYCACGRRWSDCDGSRKGCRR